MYFTKNMARFSFFTQLLLLSFAAFLLASDTSLIKVPQSPKAAGVFMLVEGGKYTFNFTTAGAACLFLNVTIATKAQMERAVQHGLETCKFGWIAERIAVVPRLTSDKNCGKGNTGVVLWYAKPEQMFGVFCFNASDLEETPDRSTASPQSSALSTTPTALTQTSAPATSPPRSTTKSPPSLTTKFSEQTSFTSAFKFLFQTTRSPRILATTTPKPLSTHIPTSLSHPLTSKPTVTIRLAFSTSAHASSFSVSSKSATLRPTNSTKPSLGDVPTTLIILGIILLLLTAAGIVWYYKLNIFTMWSQGLQKDDIETEMWKHADSETDLHSQHEGEEEESDRKYSSDITLCVNPDIKTNSSE
ncbi:lymphatic vessel endothelial hyaluronic receptor 1b isoform X2 [Plectropomus leopardus]|uniref:lymphatic vessel endothelial hyaluronic receptor 1b isoform X2 n=1 Tax=Plectropomus leopardus TaxID=160734 RepID=UPI001C4DD493|nr:lymphatic vessel endothelial hyaluronic receptor 1b isoform X2 [Plectropomus leopardus]